MKKKLSKNVILSDIVNKLAEDEVLLNLVIDTIKDYTETKAINKKFIERSKKNNLENFPNLLKGNLK